MKLKRLTGLFLSVLLMLAILPLFPLPAQAAANDIAIDSTNFPDAVFRDYVRNTLAGGSGTLTAGTIASVTSIDVSEMGIADLTGIEYFTNLTDLDCHGNQLPSLRLRLNNKLVNLYCWENPIVWVDLPDQGISLRKLDCHSTAIVNLAVSWVVYLDTLIVYDNPMMTGMNCSGRQLTELDLHGCVKLKNLNCSKNRLTELDLEDCTELITLNCGDNLLTELDLSHNQDLYDIVCRGNRFTSLDLSGRSDLRILDASDNLSLTTLNCSGCDLQSLKVTGNYQMQTLNCSSNKLTSLDLSGGMYRLSNLDIHGNASFGSLEIGNCPELCKAYNDTRHDLGSFYWWTHYTNGVLTSQLKADASVSVSATSPAPYVLSRSEENVFVTAEETVTFETEICFADSYRWQYSKDDGASWTDCTSAGHDTDTFAFTAKASMDGRRYRLTAEGAGGTIVIGFTLRVFAFRSQPSALTAAPGDPVSFSVTATQSPAYRWQYSKDNGSTWIDCTSSGSDQATFSFTARESMDGRRYRCRITKGSLTLFSKAVKLTVRTPLPEITAQPSRVTAEADDTAAFTVGAAGIGLTYQWQYSKDNGSTWIDCTSSGHNRATFSFKAKEAMNGRRYRCIVSNSAGSVASNGVKLTVTVSKPVIDSQPSAQSVTAGGTAGFTVAASGSGLSYQWQYSKDNGSTWINCSTSGYNRATFTFTAKASMNGRRYRCVVTNSAGSSTSSAAKLTVK